MRKTLTTVLIVAITILLTSVFAMSAKAQQPYTKTFSMDDSIPNAAGWSYWFIPTGGVADTLNVKMSCVTKAEGPHGAHRHNHSELFVLVEGEAIVQLNGVDHVFHPGDGCMCPGGSNHSIRRADLSKPIRYLMFNTDTPGGLKAPLPFFKDDYTMDDCYVPAGKKSFWYLKPEQTLGGLNVKSILMKGKKVHKDPADGRQLVYFIMEGTADITVDGQAVRLPAMSVCYVPAGSTGTIASAGGRMRYLAIRTH